ncbi:MAG: NADH-quinone oxidoreductase subunit NuoH [Lautropia sp.]|nr:NADH-quinone oxidoreductase subunit NuoH [Lautropia sp.]
MNVVDTITETGQAWLGGAWPVVWALIRIIALVAPLMICVAYLTLWERKMIGYMHVRIGPNRVGPFGLLQPMADGIKLMLKEILVPTQVSKVLFLVAPVMAIMPALAAWVVIPFGPERALANVNAGLLLLLALTSLEVYGVILAGWASNSKYAFLGALRAAAQMVSYELAIGFCLVVVLMVTGSMNISAIVEAQGQGRFAESGLNFLSWNWLPLLPILVVYFVSAVAETNRHPFDVVEGESEIVAGHMVEYAGMSFAVFFLAEYANMILVSALAAIMFFGGWQPFFTLGLDIGPQWFWDWFWLFIKTFFLVSLFVWFRASFPRYRYDQIMRLGWKVFIPVTLVWLIVVAIWMQTPFNIWKI